MRKLLALLFILAGCAERMPVSAPDAVSVPVEEEKWDSKTLAEFPMGCQYKGYELCNPIMEWGDLAEEDKDIWVPGKKRNVYFPQKRLYFPMDWKQIDRETGEKIYDPEYFLGEWSTFRNEPADKSIIIARTATPNGISLQVKIKDAWYVDPELSDYENSDIVYDCPDMIARAKNYWVFGCKVEYVNLTSHYTGPPQDRPPVGSVIYVKLLTDHEDIYRLAKVDITGLDLLNIEISDILPCLQEMPDTALVRGKPTLWPPETGDTCGSPRYSTKSIFNNYERRKGKE